MPAPVRVVFTPLVPVELITEAGPPLPTTIEIAPSAAVNVLLYIAPPAPPPPPKSNPPPPPPATANIDDGGAATHASTHNVLNVISPAGTCNTAASSEPSD